MNNRRYDTRGTDSRPDSRRPRALLSLLLFPGAALGEPGAPRALDQPRFFLPVFAHLPAGGVRDDGVVDPLRVGLEQEAPVLPLLLQLLLQLASTAATVSYTEITMTTILVV